MVEKGCCGTAGAWARSAPGLRASMSRSVDLNSEGSFTRENFDTILTPERPALTHGPARGRRYWLHVRNRSSASRGLCRRPDIINPAFGRLHGEGVGREMPLFGPRR